jgi:hypothetical protein
MGDDLPLRWSIEAHADTIMHYEALQAERDALAAEIARLRAGIAGVKAKGIAMQNEAHYEHQKYAGWGWKWAGEWLEALAQETQP